MDIADRIEVYRMALEATQRLACEGVWDDANHRLRWLTAATENLALNLIDRIEPPEPPKAEPTAGAMRVQAA